MDDVCACGCRTSVAPGRKYLRGHQFRKRKMHCGSCDYDFEGKLGSTCPKCGYKVNVREVMKQESIEGSPIKEMVDKALTCLNCKVKWREVDSAKCPRCGGSKVDYA